MSEAFLACHVKPAMCQPLGDAGQTQGQFVVAMACIFIPRHFILALYVS